MTLFTDINTLTIPSQKKANERTADDILRMTQNRIRNWAKASNNGSQNVSTLFVGLTIVSGLTLLGISPDLGTDTIIFLKR